MVDKAAQSTPITTLDFANYRLFTGDLSLIPLDRRVVINTLNPHSFYIAENDIIFRKALENSDVLLPDGIGIVWACRFLKKISIRRISGMDVFLHLLSAAAKKMTPPQKVFFLGASPTTLNKIQQRLQQEYPGISVDVYSPPFKEIFSAHDNEQIIGAINAFDPDLLFVGMTAPKQEKWVYENKERVTARVICSIGAVFDYYAGTIKRPGEFWRRIGLEWFIRFLREPKRLWKRNLISGPFFVFRVFKLKMNN